MQTYTIDWTAESVKWYIGSNMVRQLNYADPLAVYGKNYPQTPMRVKMGSWVGCADQAAADDPKTAGTCSWAGGPADFSKGPFTMYVQSVTIQDYGCGGDYTYTDMSGDYTSIKSSGVCGTNNANSGSGSSSSSSTASATATKSTSSASGGLLLQTSSTVSSVSSTPTGTGTAAAQGANSGATGTGSSTMSTATKPTGSATGSGTGSGAASTSTPLQVTTSAADTIKPKHKYGVLDFAVIGLGLGLGYLVM